MSTLDRSVASHYDLDGLLQTILNGIGGVPADGRLDPEALSPVEEFHLAGAAATERLIPMLEVHPGMRVLDVGSGVGGPARHVARTTGAFVTGIDLTPGYRAIAEELSRLTGLADRTTYVTGSATEMPFADGEFDAAMMLHVGMNIPDKAALMAEVARVVGPGNVFLVYDVMRVGEGGPEFPVPWAATPGTSFVETPAAYRSAAEAAGLVVEAETSRAEAAKAFLKETRARMEQRKAEGLPPPPGVNLVMGADAPVKLGNLAAAVLADRLAPVELILRTRA